MRLQRIGKQAAIGLSAAALVALAAGCGSGSSDGGTSGAGETKTLTWVSSGGAGQEAQAATLQKAFTDKEGVKFENVSPFALGQLKTMVDAGKPTWDIVGTTPAYAFQYCGKYFEKLDKSKFSDIAVDDGVAGDCVMPGAKYGIAFAYNKDMYKGAQPSKLADFFDTTAFPGKRVIYDQPNAILEMALLADGVPSADLYPLDVDRAMKQMDRIKKDLQIVPSYTALQQNLVSKQAAMTITLTGRMSITADSGANLVPVWEHTMWDYTGLSVVKGSPNRDLAEQALVTAMGKEASVAYAAASGLVSVRNDVDPASVKQTDTQRKFNPFIEGNGEVIAIDHDYYAQNQDQLTKRWTNWKVGG